MPVGRATAPFQDLGELWLGDGRQDLPKGRRGRRSQIGAEPHLFSTVSLLEGLHKVTWTFNCSHRTCTTDGIDGLMKR